MEEHPIVLVQIGYAWRGSADGRRQGRPRHGVSAQFPKSDVGIGVPGRRRPCLARGRAGSPWGSPASVNAEGVSILAVPAIGSFAISAIHPTPRSAARPSSRGSASADETYRERNCGGGRAVFRAGPASRSARSDAWGLCGRRRVQRSPHARRSPSRGRRRTAPLPTPIRDETSRLFLSLPPGPTAHPKKKPAVSGRLNTRGEGRGRRAVCPASLIRLLRANGEKERRHICL